MDKKIAVLNPNYGFLTGDRTLHRWAECFISKHQVVNYEEAKYYDGDIIVCFNGRPDLPEQVPPKEFKGIKIVHLQDHVFRVKETLKALKDNDVQYVMGYNALDKHDPFFKHFYKEYVGKVIPVPFGFNDLRFLEYRTPFNERKNKVIALGSVNPVSDPLCLSDIKEYAEFNKHEKFTHKWRRALVENAKELENEMDSMLPVFPETKDFGYDIMAKYNEYKMFTTCESIMNYPSVKTFEGMVCGSVFICADKPCYKDIGLVHGVNCFMHEPDNINSFKAIVNIAQANPEWTEEVAEAGRKHILENFWPADIATNLHHKLCSL